MKIELYSFQKKAIDKIHYEIEKSVKEYVVDSTQQIISYTAPTGSGKTIIMTAVIEDLFFGDENGVFVEKPESIIVWLSDSPELNKQSLDKMVAKSDKIRVNQLITIEDSSFHESVFENGKIYFLNTQKLGKGNGLVRYSDSRQYTIWDVFNKTIEEKGEDLILIIDEAHRGMNDKKAGYATSIMQKFIKGSEEDGLVPSPIILGMSATIRRFNTLVGNTDSTVRKISTTPEEVRESGILKDKIYATYPDKGYSDMAVLQAAVDNWKDKCDRWKMYATEQHRANVNPILLVQVKNGTKDTVSTSDLDECMLTIENRLGYKFKEGEVVHSFGDCDEIKMNGLVVKKCEASKINENMNIKIVFFKDALSTGWDCPRAETMISFRTASDYTYIAQILGRIIRTPLGRRIHADEELNNVHVYLLNFDKDNVGNIVKYLNENETGDIPIDFEARSSEDIGNHEPLTVYYDSEDSKDMSSPDNLAGTGSACLTEGDAISSGKGGENKGCSNGEKYRNEVSKNKSSISQKKSEKDGVDRRAILEFINKAGIPTYNIVPKSRKKPLSSLFNIVDLISMSGLDYDIRDNIYSDIVEIIRAYILSLKNNAAYEDAISNVKKFSLNTREFDTINLSATNVNELIESISTDIDIDRKLRQASKVLYSEEIATSYGKKYPDNWKIDVILFANDKDCLGELEKYAMEKFNSISEKFRRVAAKEFSDTEKSKWHTIVRDGNPVSKDNFSVPYSAEIPTDDNGSEYPRHLLLRRNGNAPKFKFTSWESKTIEEELSTEGFQCWLRNPSRKNWSLCIPYEINGEKKGMYPDFIVVRKDNEGYIFDILEPHRSDTKDNFNKARGLAEYARDNGNENIGRIQLIRLVNDKLVRLDLMNKEIRERVLKATSVADIDKLFDDLSKI